MFNLIVLRGQYFSWGPFILYLIHAAAQGFSYLWVKENMKSMMFLDALSGYLSIPFLTCSYGGDLFIISMLVSIFLPFSRKWMWVYIIVWMRFLGNPVGPSVSGISGHSTAPQLGFFSRSLAWGKHAFLFIIFRKWRSWRAIAKRRERRECKNTPRINKSITWNCI